MTYDLGQRIKNIRINLGKSMDDFGKMFSPNVTKGTISKWENGKYLPNNVRLKKIAQMGNMTVEELLGDSFSECPQCQNKKIKPDYNFCPICRFELKGGNINDK